MTPTPNPALIIFAKRPFPGQVKTRLAPPLLPEEAAHLYECMLLDILDRTALCGVDRYLFYEDEALAADYFSEVAAGTVCLPQAGRGLGERMEEAFRQVFARGCRPVIIIGTDSPDLPLPYLTMAWQRLQEPDGSVVIGPSDDGGYYLLGMNRLHPELFHGVPWSSGDVLRKSLENAAAAGLDADLLPRWYDVDTFEDLMRLKLADDDCDAPRTRRYVQELDLSFYFRTSRS